VKYTYAVKLAKGESTPQYKENKIMDIGLLKLGFRFKASRR
jgi:hypothetical protein